MTKVNGRVFLRSIFPFDIVTLPSFVLQCKEMTIALRAGFLKTKLLLLLKLMFYSLVLFRLYGPALGSSMKIYAFISAGQIFRAFCQDCFRLFARNLPISTRRKCVINP